METDFILEQIRNCKQPTDIQFRLQIFMDWLCEIAVLALPPWLQLSASQSGLQNLEVRYIYWPY